MLYSCTLFYRQNTVNSIFSKWINRITSYKEIVALRNVIIYHPAKKVKRRKRLLFLRIIPLRVRRLWLDSFRTLTPESVLVYVVLHRDIIVFFLILLSCSPCFVLLLRLFGRAFFSGDSESDSVFRILFFCPLLFVFKSTLEYESFFRWSKE